MKISKIKNTRIKRAPVSFAFQRGGYARGAQPTVAPVILLAHGSRRPGAHRTIDRIAERLSAESLTAGSIGSGNPAAAPVLAAFLDFSHRTLPAVAAELSAFGYREAIVVPLLFTSAFHLNQDVPRAVVDAEHLSGLQLRTTAPVGLGEDVADLLVEHWHATQEAEAHQALGRAGKPVDIGDAVIYAVGSSTPGANQAVKALARKVGERLGVPATALFATGGGIGLQEHRAGLGQQGLTAPSAGLVAAPGAGLVAAPTAVLPLFFAPGLLLDKGVREAAAEEVLFAPPLGTRVVGVLKNRIRESQAGAEHAGAELAGVGVRAS